MPTYRVRIVGTDFDAEDEGIEYLNTDAAAEQAIRAAIAIAADEATRGSCGAVLEARVEDGTNVIAHYIVALSVEQVDPR